MEWDRSETLALANHECSYCQGLGLVMGKRGRSSPCNCVFRGIFRACLERFRQCAEKEKYMSKVTLTFIRGRINRMTYGRKDEEYMADFFLVSKRYLEPAEFELFKFHFLYGADWKLCCRRLNMDRGAFFHAVYRIQQRLGRVFRELEPHALFPLDEYFSLSDRAKAEPYEIDRVLPDPTPRELRLKVRTLRRMGPRPVVPPLAKALDDPSSLPQAA